ncbi:MAG: hypothetical protein AAGI51_01080 [Pseudomonadota bacterium]
MRWLKSEKDARYCVLMARDCGYGLSRFDLGGPFGRSEVSLRKPRRRGAPISLTLRWSAGPIRYAFSCPDLPDAAAMPAGAVWDLTAERILSAEETIQRMLEPTSGTAR